MSFRSVPFGSYPTHNRKFQKNSKKFQKCHYVIISSQNRLKNAEKERIQNLSFRFVPTQRVIENSKKIAKKFKKLNNTILWLHYKPKLVGKRREREKIKIIVPFRSYTTRNRKFQKNRKKNLKNETIPLWHHFKPK